ncbi:hypothetical protein [Snodgrassella communis]|uniref:hypothetical protein n=1 Tax=Snodgrassella communis TaxID=2946699 RepID=UPI0015D547C8|nr:hypothetical protein [Snodgrassella communis]
MGITFEKLSAIDANCLTNEQRAVFNQQVFASEYKREVVDNEIVCALSHQQNGSKWWLKIYRMR